MRLSWTRESLIPPHGDPVRLQQVASRATEDEANLKQAALGQAAIFGAVTTRLDLA